MSTGLLDSRPSAQKRRAVETQDFTAVILVGNGENLYPFNQGTNVLPKALIPVGNIPIINLVLDWVFEAGLTDILIVVPPSTYSAISEYLQQSYTSASHPRARINLKSYTEGEKEEDEDESERGEDTGEKTGTARLLRRFRSLIKTDFVLLPCDISFPSSLTLALILDKHRATPDAVLTSVFYEPVEAVKDSEEKLLVATDKETNELLLIQPLETIEEELEIRMALITSHPTLSLSTRLLDAHVYVFRRTVLDLLAGRKSRELSSVREQFVPYLVKGGWQEGLGHKWAPILCPPRRDPLAGALSRSVTTSYEAAATFRSNAIPLPSDFNHSPLLNDGDELLEFKDSISAHSRRSHRSKTEPIPWSCRVIIAKPAAPAPPAPSTVSQGGKGGKAGGGGGGKASAGPEPEYLIRSNSLAGYWELNRRWVRSLAPTGAAGMAAVAAANAAASAAESTEISTTAQISPDSLVGDGARIGDRASMKKCIVGRHCNIGRGAKLTGCVLWDFVTVEENARIENAILCSHVRIGEKAQIKDCELGAGFEALPGAILKGERLIAGQEA